MASRKKKIDVEAFNRQAREKKLKEFQGRQGKEEELWRKWKKSKNQADLVKLMKSMETLVKAEARKFSGAGYGGALVSGANEAELRRRLFDAIKSYDPNKPGAGSLKNWTYNKFRSMSDVARKRRNFARMSTQDTDQFATYTNAVNALKARGILHPTNQQVAAELKWPGKKGLDRVARLERGIRKEKFVGAGMDDATYRSPSQARTIASMIVLRNEEEKKIFKALKLHDSQLEVKDKFTMQRTAKKMGIPYHRFARIRDTLKKRVDGLTKKI